MIGPRPTALTGRLIRRVLIATGVAVLLLGLAAGAAGASGQAVLAWNAKHTVFGTYDYNYGTVPAGRPVSRTFLLRNTGTAPTSHLTVALAGSPVFTKTNDGCTGTTLAPNQSCSVTVTYGPTVNDQTYAAVLAAGTFHGQGALLTLRGASAKASPTIATTAGAGGPAGTTVIDIAALSGGSAPGGSVEFKLYGPSATASCSSTPVDDETVTVSGDGSYTTHAGAKPSQAGTYWWTASYSGDAYNNPATTACGDEQVAIGKAAPAISTIASAGGPAGTAVTDTAALSGGSAPGGTVEFKLYGPSAAVDCSGTAVFDQTVTVTGDGSYTSPSFSLSQAGTYWWTASYSGDPNNSPAATNCGDEQVAIAASARIYWSEYLASTIMEANLDGTGVQTLVSVQAQDGPYGMAVDSSHIYWTIPGGGTIMEANLDGSNPQTLISGQNGPYGVAVDSSHIYWADEHGGTIMEANLDGTGVQTLVTGQATALGVAVDSSHIYWTVRGSPDMIMEANLDGTGVQTLVSVSVSIPDLIAVGSGHIYWSDQGSGPGEGTVMEANLDGTGVTTLVTGQSSPHGVAVDSSHIYWADNNGGAGTGTIMEANLDGTGVQTLVSGQTDPQGVAVGPQ